MQTRASGRTGRRTTRCAARHTRRTPASRTAARACARRSMEHKSALPRPPFPSRQSRTADDLHVRARRMLQYRIQGNVLEHFQQTTRALVDERAHLRLAGVALLPPPAVEVSDLVEHKSTRRVAPQRVHQRIDYVLHACSAARRSPVWRAAEENTCSQGVRYQ